MKGPLARSAARPALASLGSPIAAAAVLRCGPARLRRGNSVHSHGFDGDGMVLARLALGLPLLDKAT